MKPKETEPKAILVRFPSHELRDAWQRYCKDNERNLSSQIRVLVTQELEAHGYIKPKKKFNTQ